MAVDQNWHQIYSNEYKFKIGTLTNKAFVYRIYRLYQHLEIISKYET